MIELKPIRITSQEWDGIEKKIKELFKREIYIPCLRELYEPGRTLVKNAIENQLFKALQSGRITFFQGTFSGKFNSAISKQLKDLGAKFDRKTGTFKINVKDLPMDVRNHISSTETKFKERINKLDEQLAKIIPEEIAGKLNLKDNFDRVIWKTEADFKDNVKNIAVAPQVSETAHRKIVDEWQTNMDLWINDFLEEEIVELRTNIKKSVFSGNRYESAIKAVQKSYGVSANKAKFLARQETKLLATTFQEARYADVGIKEYTWHSVTGTPAHPVRPQHKALADASKKGKIYSYDDPPITSEPNQPTRRNNPGQDYNCRCFSRPIVTFKK